MNLYIIAFIIILVFNLIKNKKSLHMLQQNLYNENNRYIKWLSKNIKYVFVSLDLLAMLLFVFAYISTNKIASDILIILSLILYILEMLRLMTLYKRRPKHRQARSASGIAAQPEPKEPNHR